MDPQEPKWSPRVTVAFCGTDDGFARRLAADLSASGIDVRVAEHEPEDAQSAVAAAHEAVGAVGWFVVVLSQAATRAAPGSLTWAGALAQQIDHQVHTVVRSRTLWCRIDDCPLPACLQEWDVVDFATMSYSTALQRMTNRIWEGTVRAGEVIARLGGQLPDQMWAALQDSLENLSYREREVAKLSFGLEGGYIFTFGEIGRIFNITADKVARIAEGALRKVRTAEPIRRALDSLTAEESAAHQAELRSVIAQVRALTPELIAHLRGHHDQIDHVNPRVFEELIAEFFASWGFEQVLLVGRDARTSADILAVESHDKVGHRVRYFVEVRRVRDRVGVGVIDRVLGAIAQERDRWGWHIGMIVSTAGFCDFRKYTRNDLELRGLLLRDKEDVLAWLQDYRPSDKGLWLPPGFRVYELPPRQ